MLCAIHLHHPVWCIVATRDRKLFCRIESLIRIPKGNLSLPVPACLLFTLLAVLQLARLRLSRQHLFPLHLQAMKVSNNHLYLSPLAYEAIVSKLSGSCPASSGLFSALAKPCQAFNTKCMLLHLQLTDQVDPRTRVLDTCHIWQKSHERRGKKKRIDKKELRKG